jgi:hypothetical protein
VKLPPLDTTFPPRLTRVGERVFSGCTALTAIDLPASVISNGLFEGCTSLTEVDLSLAIRIGEDVFRETGAGYLTVILPRSAPNLPEGSSLSSSYAKTVIVNQIADNAGYDTAWLAAFKKLFGGGARITITGESEFFPLTSVAAARAYLANVSRGGFDNTPVRLPMKVNLAGGADSLANLFAAIADAGKYVDLDLSACTMAGTEFDPDNMNSAGKNRVVSLTLPDTAVSIKASKSTFTGTSTFKHFNSLRAAGGSAVKSIGEQAFELCRALTQADFPAATSIGDLAFYGCPALAAVNMPAAASIGKYAFYGCTALAAVNMPAAATIGEHSFEGCTSLATGIDFPAVTNLPAAAFKGCAALSTVSFPAAASIGESAFEGCRALTTGIDFPAVRSIPAAAFKGCASLRAVSFPAATSIGGFAFEGCRALAAVSFPAAASIGESAFEGCTSLAKGVDFPAARSIPAAAFKGCAALSAVSFPAAASIGGFAFEGCRALASVNLPAAASIGGFAFEGCRALAAVNLPAAASIGEGAFQSCTSLKEAGFPKAAGVGNTAFKQCAALASVSLPAATSIGGYAFQNCAALTSLNLSAAASIGANAFHETGAKPLAITLPANAPALGAGSAASFGYSKTVTVNRPAENGGYDGPWQDAFKKSFGGSANITLSGNPKFWSFPLASAAEAREYLASELRGGSVNNPVSLQMKVNLAGGADSLANLLAEVQAAGKFVGLDLSLCSMNGTEFNPDGGNSTGKRFVVSLVLPDAAQVISGSTWQTPSTFNHFNNLVKITGRNITSLGHTALFGRAPLVEAVFPKLQWIGTGALQGCRSLKEVDFPDLNYIEWGAFARCASLTRVNAPNVTYITDEAFIGCTSLEEAYFPKVTNVRHRAFQECTSLKRAHFPSIDNGDLGGYVFAYCTSLEYVNLSFYEPTIPTYAVGLFFETGSTPLTVEFNPLEGNTTNSPLGDWVMHIPDNPPASVSYSKSFTIRHGPDNSPSSRYDPRDDKGQPNNSDIRNRFDRLWKTLFGAGASLSVSVVEY